MLAQQLVDAILVKLAGKLDQEVARVELENAWDAAPIRSISGGAGERGMTWIHQGGLQVVVVHLLAVDTVAVATGAGVDADVSAFLGRKPIQYPVVQIYEGL